MTVSETIVLGVVSGVLSSAAIFLTVKVFNALFVPWFQKVVYRGVNVAGTWYCLAFDMAQEIRLDLQQHAHTLTGTASFVHLANEIDKSPEFETLRSFSVVGSIQDRFIYLTLRHSDAQRLGVNSYLLEVKGDGRRLEGVFSFYSVRSDVIQESFHTLYRDRSKAEEIKNKQERQFTLELEQRPRPKRSPKKPESPDPTSNPPTAPSEPKAPGT